MQNAVLNIGKSRSSSRFRFRQGGLSGRQEHCFVRARRRRRSHTAFLLLRDDLYEAWSACSTTVSGAGLAHICLFRRITTGRRQFGRIRELLATNTTRLDDLRVHSITTRLPFALSDSIVSLASPRPTHSRHEAQSSFDDKIFTFPILHDLLPHVPVLSVRTATPSVFHLSRHQISVHDSSRAEMTTQLRPQPPRISRPTSMNSIRTSSSLASLDAASRRRSALLELDTPLRTSLQRAQDALRASERGRIEDEMRAEMRARTRSTRWAAEPVARVEPSPEREVGAASTTFEQARRLRKARSIPVKMLPPALRTFSHATNRHDASIQTAAPPSQPRKSLSHSDLVEPNLSRQPVSILRTSPEHGARLPSRLPVPGEPPSKFSFSSGESRIDSMRNMSLRARERTVGTAHSFKNLLKKTPSRRSLVKKRSAANLPCEGSNYGSVRGKDEHYSNMFPKDEEDGRGLCRAGAMSAQISPPSTSYTSPSPSTLASTAPESQCKGARTGFFRSALKNITGRRSGSDTSSSHARTASNVSSSTSTFSLRRVSDLSSPESTHSSLVERLRRGVGGVKGREHNKDMLEKDKEIMRAERVQLSISGEQRASSLLLPS